MHCCTPQGDTVGIVINHSHNALSFTLNGVHLGVAGRDIKQSSSALSAAKSGEHLGAAGQNTNQSPKAAPTTTSAVHFGVNENPELPSATKSGERSGVAGQGISQSLDASSASRRGVHLGVAGQGISDPEPLCAMVSFIQSGITLMARDGSPETPFLKNMDDLYIEEEIKHNFGRNREPWSAKEKVCECICRWRCMSKGLAGV